MSTTSKRIRWSRVFHNLVDDLFTGETDRRIAGLEERVKKSEARDREALQAARRVKAEYGFGGAGAGGWEPRSSGVAASGSSTKAGGDMPEHLLRRDSAQFRGGS